MPMVGHESTDFTPQDPDYAHLPAALALGEILRPHADARPDHEAIADGERSLSYLELEQISDALAAVLARRRISVGDRICVAAEKRLATVVTALAAWKVGAVYVPVDPRLSPPRASALVEAVAPKLTVGLAALGRAAADLAFDSLCRELEAAPAGLDAPPVVEPEDAALILAVGDEDDPRLVVLSHAAILAYFRGLKGEFGLQPASRCLNTAALSSVHALQDTYLPLAMGARLRLAPHGRSLGLELLSDEAITHLAAAPALLADLAADPEGLARHAPAALRTISTGQPAPDARWPEAWRQALPGLQISAGYSVAECCGVALLRRLSGAAEAMQTPVLGRPLRRVSVRLLDAADAVVGRTGEAGQLALGGPQLMLGYWGEPGTTARALREVEGEPYFCTGAWCSYTGRGELLLQPARA